jgi:hypothetical protein
VGMEPKLFELKVAVTVSSYINQTLRHLVRIFGIFVLYVRLFKYKMLSLFFSGSTQRYALPSHLI